MKFLGKTIIIDRELSDLDKFTIEFINILKKHTKYVVISGYVSILLGRSRTSEDVDILIPRIDQSTFNSLHDELISNGYYCLNAEGSRNIYEYLENKTAVRFAKQDMVIPNIELKCSKNKIDEITLANTLTAEIAGTKIIISNLEMQIAFKENILKSPKDIEDARHLRNVGKIDQELVKKYKEALDGFY